MSSPVSTITSNVNLLLLDTYTIVNSNQPYVAYVSSVTAPGKIATIRDSTGNLGTNFFKIRVSTTSGVSFTDGTNFFDITQPFGYLTMSSRDRNTWNILNAYAFPDPYGISYVSTVNIRDRLTTPNIFASSFVSTVHLNTTSISTLNISTNTINTSNISSVRSWFNNVSTLTLNSSNIINARNITSSNITTSNITTSNILLNDGTYNDTFVYVTSFTDINENKHRFLTYSNIVESNYVASDWSYFEAKNNVISNVSQATILNSVQTNLIMPKSVLVTTLNSYKATAGTDSDIYDRNNTTSFVFTNTGFSNYSVTLYFKGSDVTAAITGDFGYYFYLSNSTQFDARYGSHFSNTNNYFLQLDNPIFRGQTNFTFSDIYDLTGWNTNDIIYVYLHAYNGGVNDITFTNTQLSIVYQPLFV